MFDRFVTALNKLNHNASIMILFMMGIFVAVLAYVLVAKLPGAPVGVQLAFAGLGGVIIGGAMMGFRGSSDSSATDTARDGSQVTKQASVSGDPTPPAI